jgi:hypothetical protein
MPSNVKAQSRLPLVTGLWFLAAYRRWLDTRYWILDSRYSILVAGSLSLASGNCELGIVSQ